MQQEAGHRTSNLLGDVILLVWSDTDHVLSLS